MGELRILSRDQAPFRDRQEAARILGEQLQLFADEKPVVVAISNAGVIIARALGEVLHATFDVFLIRTLSAPENPALPIGTVTETNVLDLDAITIGDLAVPSAYIMRERARMLTDLVRCTSAFRQVRPRVPLTGRYVILTDEAVTDSSLVASAMRALGKEHPRGILIATPVAPIHSLLHLRTLADTIVCLQCPTPFGSVSDYYEAFPTVTDKDVVDILQDEFERVSGQRVTPSPPQAECSLPIYEFDRQ